MSRKPTYGGQAVIEGVMMKGQKNYTIAVRQSSGKITVKRFRFRSLTERYKPLKWPFIRGLINLYEMMRIGIRSINYSADKAIDADQKGEKIKTWEFAVTVIISILLALAIFKLIPYVVSGLVFSRDDRILFNLLEGLIKLGIFVGYIWLISLFPDIRRIFMYHGAEHKTIHCYEKGHKLTVANVKRYTTIHPRCGTSFLFLLIGISIILYVLIPARGFWSAFGFRLLLLIPLVSISYEVLKISDKMQNGLLFRAISAPGKLIQKLTTKEPDDQQIEVGIAALDLLLRYEGRKMPKKNA
jgi:uncharacterized protein YqhQ